MSACPKCGSERHYRVDRHQWRCRPCANAKGRETRAKWDSAKRAEVSAKAVVRKRKWRAINPHQNPAHKAVQKAIKSGRLTRQLCFQCGSPNTEGHHENYAKPLDVVWLCRTHHIARHVELNEARRKGIPPPPISCGAFSQSTQAHAEPDSPPGSALPPSPARAALVLEPSQTTNAQKAKPAKATDPTMQARMMSEVVNASAA
jgi:hypothetical protein